ncbi:MAG: histidine phosphatase family protein [Oscillospiraceae bacterium]|nr:histidine phosphatase family protein [Oscillospiraceae bacterium]
MRVDLYFVRHGQTALNQAKLLQGRSDYDLDPRGVRQAAQVGRWFRDQGIQFDCVFSSPLRRAIQTAELISETSAVLDNRLIEMDYGPYEGADLTAPPEELLFFFQDLVHHPAPAGMESLDQVVSRLGAFLESLRAASPGRTILVSTHAIALKGALEYLTPESGGSYWSKHIGNCAVYRTEMTDQGFRIPEFITMD